MRKSFVPRSRPAILPVRESELLDPLVKDADILIGHRAREGLAQFAPRLKSDFSSWAQASITSD